MKLRILLPFLLLSFLSSFAQTENGMQGSEICAHGKLMRPLGELKSQRSPGSPVHSFDVLNYNLDFDIYHCYTSPYPKSFTATNIITFKAVDALSFIKLNAVQSSLQISSVGHAATSFTHAADTLTLFLDREYLPGEIAEVRIDYTHLNVNDGAFYTGDGFVFTDSEPQGARKWFPCWDEPYDKATLTLRAKVPSNVKLGSNGRLADSLTVADTTWFTWVSRDPVATYIMVMASRVNYNLDIVYWTKPGPPYDTIPFRFYYNPGENPAPIKNQIALLADYFYSLFGDHPFEKDGFATLSPQFTWGGMENQTLTTLCKGCWISSLIAHEFTHQWFGDMITCATWADVWLNEGFATFYEAMWNGRLNGEQAYINQIRNNAAYYLATNPGWAISNPDWAVNNPGTDVLFNYSITYMKASTILHMYRYVVGDSLFFHSIYQYANDTVNFRYKTATIPDFINKMNETTGMDVSWFFNQWLFQPNHPVYNNIYSFHKSGNNLWDVHFRANQVQTNAPFFKMPLEIKVSFGSAGDTLIRVMNDENNQTFVFQFDREPKGLTFDPNQNILLKQASTIVGSGLIPAAVNPQFNLEPNPTSGMVSAGFALSKSSDISLALFDLSGRKLYDSGTHKYMAGSHIIRFDAGKYPSGSYLVTLREGSQVLTRKLVITGK